MKHILLLVLLAACGDNWIGPVDIDYAVDASIQQPDAPIDASCVRAVDAGLDDCCRFAPNPGEIGACAVATFPPGTCGVVACRLNDCTFIKVNVCAPPAVDGGV